MNTQLSPEYQMWLLAHVLFSTQDVQEENMYEPDKKKVSERELLGLANIVKNIGGNKHGEL